MNTQLKQRPLPVQSAKDKQGKGTGFPLQNTSPRNNRGKDDHLLSHDATPLETTARNREEGPACRK